MRKRLGFEQLEDRRVCALTPSFSGGTLKITGDAFPDALVLTGNGVPGTVIANGALLFTGVKNITIDTKDGADAVGIFGVIIPGNLSVKTGGGIDAVTVSNNGPISTQIFGKTSIHTGNEIFDTTQVIPNGVVTFHKATTVVSNQVNMQTGGVGSINFLDGLTIKGISGAPPVVNRIRLQGNPGGAGVVGTDVNVFGNLAISSSASAAILLDDVNVSVNASGKGGKTTVSLSKYSDGLAVVDSFFQNSVSAKFSSSDDALKIVNTVFNSKTAVDGGKGINIADVSISSFALPPSVKNFAAGPLFVGPTFPF